MSYYVEVIHESTQVARKSYHDDSCESVMESLDYLKFKGLSFSEWRSIAKAKASGWKIQKGQKYVSQFNKMDGQTFTFRTLPDILAICGKYNLYSED